MPTEPKRTAREILVDQPIVFLLNTLRKLPLVRYILQVVYQQHFARATGTRRLFRGVYRSFEEAQEAAPKTKPLHYDDTGYGYEKNHRVILASDYPVIYWLSRALKDGSSVLDFGGSVGVAYYSYEKYITYPTHLHWQVFDLPEVAEAGRRIRDLEGSPAALSFTAQLLECTCCDIFLAAGSLQYVPETLLELLAKIGTRPKHLLLNKLPVCECDSFATLQNTGTGFSPYRVINRKELLDQVTRLGYDMEDCWENPDMTLMIPGEPAHSLGSFTGMYCRQRAK